MYRWASFINKINTTSCGQAGHEMNLQLNQVVVPLMAT